MIYVSEVALKKISELDSYDLEPGNYDVFAMESLSLNETVSVSYEVMRSWFLSTTTNSEVNSNSMWLDNKKIILGNDGDFSMYHDSNTISTKIDVKTLAGLSINMITFYPETNAIAIGQNTISDNSDSSRGISITAYGKLSPKKGITMGTKFINGGNSEAGLWFPSSSVNGRFSDDLTVDGDCTMKSTLFLLKTSAFAFESEGPIIVRSSTTLNGLVTIGSNMGISGYINQDGINGKGLRFGDSTGKGYFYNGLNVTGNITANEISSTDMDASDNINCGTSIHLKGSTNYIYGNVIQASTRFSVNGTMGLTTVINLNAATTIGVLGGIITVVS